MSVNSTYYNQKFLQAIRKEGGMQKVAFAIGDYIATKVREDSFLDKILPPETVAPTDLQGNEDNDTLEALCEIEPEDTAALTLNIDGEPTGKYISAPRFKVPFWLNSSRRFEKATHELLAYRMKIKDIIERNAVNQLVVMQDTQWLAQCQTAVELSEKVVESDNTRINREDIVSLVNQLEGDELDCERLLIRKDDWNQIMTLASDQINTGAWETFKNGYVEKTIFGYPCIVSLKNVINPGEIWAFSPPRFIGKHFIIEDTRAELKEEFGLLEFQMQKYFGFNIGNIDGIAKLELSTSSS